MSKFTDERSMPAVTLTSPRLTPCMKPLGCRQLLADWHDSYFIDDSLVDTQSSAQQSIK